MIIVYTAFGLNRLPLWGKITVTSLMYAQDQGLRRGRLVKQSWSKLSPVFRACIRSSDRMILSPRRVSLDVLEKSFPFFVFRSSRAPARFGSTGQKLRGHRARLKFTARRENIVPVKVQAGLN